MSACGAYGHQYGSKSHRADMTDGWRRRNLFGEGNDLDWTHGYWTWNGSGYAWTPGHCELQQPGQHWVPAHYDQNGGSYTFVPGQWEQ